MGDISKKIGKKVEKSVLKGLSQGDISRRLNLHRLYISDIEHGVRNPSLKIIQKIAKALEININKLI
jgi:transcriptional regulator with XRE-family HTH domain